jgi:hypothetical protein
MDITYTDRDISWQKQASIIGKTGRLFIAIITLVFPSFISEV